MNENIEYKNNIKTVYKEMLPKCIQLNDIYQNWRFNILIENKEEVLKAIFEKGLFASNHYKPISGSCNIYLKNATKLYEHTINLFIDRYYNLEFAQQTAEIIKKVAKPVKRDFALCNIYSR